MKRAREAVRTRLRSQDCIPAGVDTSSGLSDEWCPLTDTDVPRCCKPNAGNFSKQGRCDPATGRHLALFLTQDKSVFDKPPALAHNRPSSEGSDVASML